MNIDHQSSYFVDRWKFSGINSLEMFAFLCTNLFFLKTAEDSTYLVLFIVLDGEVYFVNPSS